MPSVISSNPEQQILSLGPSPSLTKSSSKLHVSWREYKGLAELEKEKKQ